VDLNGDNHGDILSGSYSRMEESMAGLFQVLWGQPDKGFSKSEPLKGTDDNPLIIPIEGDDQQLENICTRPTAVDWDADGDLDLVVGNFAGSFYLFTGEGNGRFAPSPQPIMTGDSRLAIEGHHSDPFLVDWDHDGDIDLLSGSSQGGVQWAENTAGAGKVPVLNSFQSLIAPVSNITYGELLKEEDLTGPTSATRVWVDDVNSDGRLDVLVGDNVTLITPAEGVSEEEFKEKHAKWKEALAAASAELGSSTEDATKRQEAQNRYREIYEERTQFMIEERTGFVWLYLQR
jgi:hypothetical protein